MALPGSQSSTSVLPGLVAVVIALLGWWQGDRLRSDRALSEQQVATSTRLLHSSGGSLDAGILEARRQQAHASRQAIEHQLADDADLEMIRARTYYDLRQRCFAVKLNCIIRLSELEAGADRGKPAAEGQTSALGKLGVSRARATVTGMLGDQELTDVIHAFTTDPERVWRLNRVQIKGRGFEFDIERHVRATGGAS